jgi:hypothetical protein
MPAPTPLSLALLNQVLVLSTHPGSFTLSTSSLFTSSHYQLLTSYFSNYLTFTSLHLQPPYFHTSTSLTISTVVSFPLRPFFFHANQLIDSILTAFTIVIFNSTPKLTTAFADIVSQYNYMDYIHCPNSVAALTRANLQPS